MKGFEKWWNEERTLEETFIELGNPRSQDQLIEVLPRVTWRAALEWVLKESETWGEQVFWRCLCEMIREELEE